MKLKKILAMAAVAVFGGVSSVSAQFTSGTTYYLQNVETGRFVSSGATWGTKATLSPVMDIATTLETNGSNWNIKTLSGSGKVYLGKDAYIDQYAQAWTIEAVTGESNTYTIKADGKYLGNSNYIISKDLTEVNNSTKWVIKSKADYESDMINASVQNPVNCSFYIKAPNANYANNPNYNTSWGIAENVELRRTNLKIEKGDGNTYRPHWDALSPYTAQIYNANNTTSQSVTVSKVGVYAIGVYGFYRASKREASEAYLYAGDEKVKLKFVEDDAQSTSKWGCNVARNGKYVPNSNADAGEAFEHGLYKNILYIRVDDPSTPITIGINKERTEPGDWTCWDNFFMEYYGDVTVTEVKLADYVSAYNEAMTAAVEAVEQDMSADDKTVLDQKIADNTVDLNNTTAEELVNATNALKEVATDANEAYRKYQLTKTGTDITEFANIPASWTGQTGIVGWANHDDNLTGGSERYSGSMYTGDVMTMTINGLNPGTYTVTLYGAASTTGSRDKFEVLTGQNRAYLFANDALQSMEVYDRLEVSANSADKAVLTCGVKEDGVLKMGIQNKTLGANWFVIRLESITYDSNELPTTDVELVVSEAQYSTFIAPFDAELPTGVKAYTVDGIKGNELVMAEQNNIQANTPVVLFSETPVNKILSGVSQAEAATYTVGLLTGVYAPVEITDGYVLQNLANGVKFYKVNAEKAITVPANRAYLTDSAASEGKAYFSFGIADDNTTAVSTVNALIEGKAEIYSVNGVKLQKLQKGINIVNGVPVMVK